MLIVPIIVRKQRTCPVLRFFRYKLTFPIHGLPWDGLRISTLQELNASDWVHSTNLGHFPLFSDRFSINGLSAHRSGRFKGEDVLAAGR